MAKTVPCPSINPLVRPSGPGRRSGPCQPRFPPLIVALAYIGGSRQRWSRNDLCERADSKESVFSCTATDRKSRRYELTEKRAQPELDHRTCQRDEQQRAHGRH